MILLLVSKKWSINYSNTIISEFYLINNKKNINLEVKKHDRNEIL